LPDDIVWLTLALLRRFDGCGFIYVALVVDVQLAERILQAKDLGLLELRVLSRSASAGVARENPLVYGCCANDLLL
jgi:hypothetical protein